MKKYILNAIAIFTFATGLSSCGDSFLETDNYKGVDLEGGLNTVTNVSTALNGTYYQLFYYAFAGNYALAIGDIPTDITYWNTKTGHFDGIYTYTFTDTDTYLKSIWEYGYKTADNAARVIQASQALYNNASDDEKTELLPDASMLFDKVMAGLDKAFEFAQPIQESLITTLESDELVPNDVIELVSEAVSDDDAVQTTVSDGENIEDIVDEDILKELNIESIEADADSSDFQDDSLMSKQTVEEHAIKAMINQDSVSFDVKMDKALESQKVQAQAKPVEVTPSKIMEQITKQMDGLYNNSKVNIVLNPESLGKINIQLMNSKEGLTAQFTVTTPEARDLLMKGIDGLKETLTAHGVGVDNVSVKLSDTQKSDNNQNWTEQDGSRGGNKGQGLPNREQKEKGLFEKMMAQADKNENGNV